MAERQRFTIAREQAIAKMREYAMRHPDQYVLELIQAAVFRGARWISVDASITESLVTWVGAEPVTRQQLEQLFDYLFVEQTRTDTRSLQQLALGVNAMLFRKPRSLVIESGSGTAETTVRASINRTGEVTFEDTEPIVGTYIRATFRQPGWRPWRTPVVPDEEALIWQRCTHLPVPILVDGQPILGTAPSTTLWAPGLERSVSFERNGVRGVLGIVRPGVVPRVRIVVGGVTITTVHIPELGEYTGGIIADDRLRKSADGVDIVQDEAWNAMLSVAQPQIVPLLRAEHASVSTADFAPPEAPTPQSGPVLVEPMRQVGLRPDVSIADLELLDPGHPVFLVNPGNVIETHTALDPIRFPWPVLLLDDLTGGLVHERLAGRVIARLQSAEDARFVAEMQRSTRPVLHSTRVTSDAATVWLRVHVDGDAPEPSPGDGTPLLHVTDGSSHSLTRLELDLPGVWAFVDAEERPPDSLCQTLVLQSLGALFAAHPDAELDALKKAVVLQCTRPQITREGDTALLGLWLPIPLQAHADVLHALPLASGISADDLANVQGSAKIIAVSTAADLTTLRSLEHRLGVGHLSHPTRSTRRLFAAGTRDGHWIWLEPDDDWTAQNASNLLIVTACIEPDVTLDGFTPQPSPGPFIAHLVADGAEARPTFPGIVLLCRRLIDLERNQRWPERDSDLIRSIARSVVLSQQRSDKLPLQLGGRTRPVGEVASDERLRVATAHGLTHTDRWTATLSLDEATYLFDGVPIPMRIDDHHHVWADPPEAHIVYREVHRDWGHGWLGLPRQFDATLGILGVWQSQTTVLRGTEEPIPCRGWMVLTAESSATLDRDLAFEIRALYADLEDAVAAHPDDDVAAKYLKQWQAAQPTEQALTADEAKRILGSIVPYNLSTIALAGDRERAESVLKRPQDQPPKQAMFSIWYLAQQFCEASNTDFIDASETLSRLLLTQTSE